MQNLFASFTPSQNSRSSGMSDISQKRQNFRKQIRREYLDNLFRAKRTMLLENMMTSHTQTVDYKKRTLLQCLQGLKSRQFVQENLWSTINLLAMNKPFQHFDQSGQQPSPQVILNYCDQLTTQIFNETYLMFLKQPKLRAACLNAVSNLYADTKCQNQYFVEKTFKFVSMAYGDMYKWGVDEETIEASYMIGNLMRKRIAKAKYETLEWLLGWCEVGVGVLPSDPLKAVTEGMTNFFADMDTIYNPQSINSILTDHFRANREIICANLIQRLTKSVNTNLKSRTYALDHENILYFYQFFHNNKQYLLKQLAEWLNSEHDKNNVRYFLTKTIQLLNEQTFNAKTQKQIGNCLVWLLSYYSDQHVLREMQEGDTKKLEKKQKEIRFLNEVISHLHKQLFSPYFEMMLRNMCLQPYETKLIYLKVIRLLMEHLSQSLGLKDGEELYKAYEVILVQKKLETVLIDILTQMRGKMSDSDIIKEILEIHRQVITVGRGQLGLRIKESLISLLENGSLAEDMFSLVEELVMLHEEAMQMENKRDSSKCMAQLEI